MSPMVFKRLAPASQGPGSVSLGERFPNVREVYQQIHDVIALWRDTERPVRAGDLLDLLREMKPWVDLPCVRSLAGNELTDDMAPREMTLRLIGAFVDAGWKTVEEHLPVRPAA